MSLALPVRTAPEPPPFVAWEPIVESPSRRALNVVVAAVGILLTLPLMLVIAVLIKVTSPGPVIFRQLRVGLDRRHRSVPRYHRRRLNYGGRPFTMYKFRTMHGGGRRDRQVWAQVNDPRVTSVGRVLRRLRLDELPQLFNVLLGDMNVVGPRPEQPSIALKFRTGMSNYGRRQRVRPGITGWAQVSQGYDRSVDDVRRKLVLDLEYVQRQSTWEDLRIMWRTPQVMFGGRGV
jgi:lipopolysaccharide/colanic/teichoic acid biosynthesis glycosyltransferase